MSASQLAPIRAGESYPLPLFMSLVGYGRHAMRAARRRGLRVRRDGNRAFVLGDDWLSYLSQIGEVEVSTDD